MEDKNLEGLSETTSINDTDIFHSRNVTAHRDKKIAWTNIKTAILNFFKISTVYVQKLRIENDEETGFYLHGDGVWSNLKAVNEGSSKSTLSYNETNEQWRFTDKLKVVDGIILNNYNGTTTNLTEDYIFGLFEDVIPSTGQVLALHGIIRSGSVGSVTVIAVKRTSSTTMEVYGTGDNQFRIITVTNGDTSVLWADARLFW